MDDNKMPLELIGLHNALMGDTFKHNQFKLINVSRRSNKLTIHFKEDRDDFFVSISKPDALFEIESDTRSIFSSQDNLIKNIVLFLKVISGDKVIDSSKEDFLSQLEELNERN